jgi:alpha-methylacyl-CoA racemase
MRGADGERANQVMTQRQHAGPGTGPLAGLRVIEVAGIGPGPYACMMLADMGAEVIRIERPGGETRDPAGDPTLRSRRRVVLDLKQAPGVEVLLKLAERSDVLVEGFRPGVAERLGFGPDACRQRNPRLVYGRITGWGQDGPLARTAGHDITYLAMSGLLHQIGRRGAPPVPPLNVLGDFGGGGLLLAFGVLCALHERERSGQGQVVDAAIMDGAISFLSMCLGLGANKLWRDAPGENFLSGAAHYYDTYRTRDGKWVAVGAIEPQFHALLLEKLGLEPEDFAEGVGFSGRPYDELLDRVWPRLKAKLAAAIARHTRDELQSMFEGTDACVAPVLDIGEAAAHPHARARHAFVDVDGHLQNAPAPRFSRTGLPTPRAAGADAADGTTVLREAGISAAEIAALTRSGGLG